MQDKTDKSTPRVGKWGYKTHAHVWDARKSWYGWRKCINPKCGREERLKNGKWCGIPRHRWREPPIDPELMEEVVL